MLTSLARPGRTTTWFAAIRTRFGALVRELGKFGVVGATAYVVDTTIFNVFLDATGSLWAKVISTTVSATVAFVGNRFWTWRHRPRSGLRREYLLYFAFNIVGLVIGLACLWINKYGLGHFWPEIFRTRLAENLAAQVVGTAFGTLFRFWSYRRFVFAAGGPDLADPDLDLDLAVPALGEAGERVPVEPGDASRP